MKTKIHFIINNIPWILHVDMDCLIKSKPFVLEGVYYHIKSFVKSNLNLLCDYECQVIQQDEWRDNQIKNILN